jgi:hypothetical protein
VIDQCDGYTGSEPGLKILDVAAAGAKNAFHFIFEGGTVISQAGFKSRTLGSSRAGNVKLATPLK